MKRAFNVVLARFFPLPLESLLLQPFINGLTGGTDLVRRALKGRLPGYDRQRQPLPLG